MSDENECIISRHKDGRLEIQSAPEVFLCARESIEDLIARHNDLLRQLGDARELAAQDSDNSNDITS